MYVARSSTICIKGFLRVGHGRMNLFLVNVSSSLGMIKKTVSVSDTLACGLLTTFTTLDSEADLCFSFSSHLSRELRKRFLTLPTCSSCPTQ